MPLAGGADVRVVAQELAVVWKDATANGCNFRNKQTEFKSFP